MGITGTCQGYFTNPLYIYNYGSWNYVSNGGMTVTSITGETTMAKMYMYTNSNNYQFHGQTHSNSYFASGNLRTNGSINLSEFTMLNVRVNMTSNKNNSIGRCGISVDTSASTSYGSVAQTSSSSLGEVVISTNISSLSGWYYIYISATIDSTGIGDFYIYQIYLT